MSRDADDAEDADDFDYSDLRAVEIRTLQAIYPELVVDPGSQYAFTLEVPVNPAEVVTVAFPATGIVESATPAPAPAPAPARAAAHRVVDTHELAYLPSLHLRVTLPASYPADQPPTVVVTAVPPWLPRAVVDRLESDCARLWEETGRDQVVFSYVDHIQQAADDRVFGLVNSAGYLAVDMEHKVAVLNYDVAAKQAAFERETFGCGVCLGRSAAPASRRSSFVGRVHAEADHHAV